MLKEQSCFNKHRSEIVQGTISFRQLRWPFAQGTISFRQMWRPFAQATTPVSQVRCTFCRMSNASIADVEAMLPSKQRHYPYRPGSFVSRTRPPCKMPFPICALHTYYIIYAKRPFLRRKPFFSSCSPMCSCPTYEVFKCELVSFILTKYSNLEEITKNFYVSNQVIDCVLSSILEIFQEKTSEKIWFVLDESSTFALAFGKQGGQPVPLRAKRKSSLKDFHNNKRVVQERSFLFRRK